MFGLFYVKMKHLHIVCPRRPGKPPGKLVVCSPTNREIASQILLNCHSNTFEQGGGFNLAALAPDVFYGDETAVKLKTFHIIL